MGHLFDSLIEKIGARRLQEVRPLHLQGFHQFYLLKTDLGLIFVKERPRQSLKDYDAELKGLQVMEKTNTVRVPHPFCAVRIEDKAYLALEYIEMHPGSPKTDRILGEKLALMHLKEASREFGFDCDNTLGPTPQLNPWTGDWVQFFRKSRLEFQLALIQERYRDAEIVELGNRLCHHLETLFQGLSIRPSLLHGDLWAGNATVVADEPVIFDPACYYGHHEAELSIMQMFGGFSREFFLAYHARIPKAEGFEERQLCYQLYHYLNHYNIFGPGYRQSCLSILQKLV
ncbi:MAG: fructosamine kinase family protein [Parachlamydia sp.]|nr:fructosamine kinase family protein [Parachlamydia sp.]